MARVPREKVNRAMKYLLEGESIKSVHRKTGITIKTLEKYQKEINQEQPCNNQNRASAEEILKLCRKRSNYDVFKRLLTAAIISPAITQETKNGSTNKTLFPS